MLQVKKMAEYSDCWRQILPTVPLVLLTPVANLPAVSTTPVANCHRYQRHRRQIIGAVSGCGHLEVNLKAKIYIYVSSTTQRRPKKIIKIFLIEDFFHLPPVSLTPVANLDLRISQRIFEKIRNGLLEYPGAGGNWFMKRTRSKKSRDTVPVDTSGKFAAGVVDNGGNLPPALLTLAANLPPVSLTPVANLPPVSTTQGELVAKYAAGVVDTGGKFAAGVVDTGGNLPPVVHLDLLLSPRIFEKIRNDPNVIVRGFGESDSWKKPEAKNLVTLSL